MSHTITSFALAGTPHGTQLVAEIAAATSLDLTHRHGFRDGVLDVGGDLTPEQITSIQAVVDAHVPVIPPEPVPIGKHEWLKRLTDAEYVGIWASQDPQVIRLRDRLVGASDLLNLASDEMRNGVYFLASCGLLESHRPPQLLAAP